LAKVPFADAICLSCHGKGKKCPVCNGVGTVGYKRSHTLWGTAYYKGFPGEVPHIPADEGKKKPKGKAKPRARITQIRDLSPSPVGIDKDSSGNVTIRPPAATVGGRAEKAG